MKRKITLKKALILGMFCGIQQFSFGQTFFTEDFEGALDPATALPLGWTKTGLSTDSIFFVGTDVNANAAGFFPVPAHTMFAMTNDDVCNCDKSADRLILPAQDLSSYTGALRMFYSTVSDNEYGDSFSVEVSTDGGTTWTNVQTITPTNTTYDWQDLNVNLTSYLGMSNVMISFFYNDNTNWGSGMAIDDVSLTIVPPVTELALESILGHPYSIMPLNQNPTLDITVNIKNEGDIALATYDVISNVYLSTDLITPVQTYTTNGTNLAIGSSLSVVQGTFTPTSAGDYKVVNEVIATGDANLTNNMLMDSITISSAEYARDLSNLDGGPLGGGAGTDIVLGQTFDFTNRVKLDSVFFIVAPTVVGGTISVQVSNVVAGFPELTPIGMSIDLPVDQAMVDEVAANGLYFVQIPITDANGQSLMLDPGTYFIGIHETADADLMGLQHASGIISPASYFVSLDGAAYQDVAVDFGFNDRTPIIRAYVYEGVFINSSSTTNTICGTGTITLTSTESSGNQWFLDGNALPGETNQTLTVSAPGDYTVSANSYNSDITTVILGTNPIIDAGTDMTVCANENVILSGSGALTYTWDNGKTDGVAFQQAAGTITYTVTGTDLNGCSNTDQVTVISNALPVVNAGADQTACLDANSITLSGSGASTYTWTNLVIDNTPFTQAVGSTTYTVTGTSALGCSATDQVTVTINAIPTVNAGVDQTVCMNTGAMVTFTATGAVSFSWDNSVVNGAAFPAPSTTTVYTVTGTLNGCTATDQVSVIVGDCSSLTENELAKLNIYPNPSTGIVTVSIDNMETYDFINVKDQLGRHVINTVNVNSNSFNLDLSQVANGNYFVEFSGNETIKVIKIQINK